MTREPRVRRPAITPSYGLKSADEGELLPWARAVEQLERSRNYWVATTRADGRPHAMPVWGVWVGDAVLFGTDPQSVKGRNLSRSPECVVHLESGDDVVILEGAAENTRNVELLRRAADGFEEKYDWRPEVEEPGEGWWLLRPRRAYAWLERDYPSTATRYDWD